MKITKTEKSLLGLFLIKEIVAIFFTPFLEYPDSVPHLMRIQFYTGEKVNFYYSFLNKIYQLTEELGFNNNIYYSWKEIFNIPLSNKMSLIYDSYTPIYSLVGMIIQLAIVFFSIYLFYIFLNNDKKMSEIEKHKLLKIVLIWYSMVSISSLVLNISSDYLVYIYQPFFLYLLYKKKHIINIILCLILLKYVDNNILANIFFLYFYIVLNFLEKKIKNSKNFFIVSLIFIIINIMILFPIGLSFNPEAELQRESNLQVGSGKFYTKIVGIFLSSFYLGGFNQYITFKILYVIYGIFIVKAVMKMLKNKKGLIELFSIIGSISAMMYIVRNLGHVKYFTYMNFFIIEYIFLYIFKDKDFKRSEIINNIGVGFFILTLFEVFKLFFKAYVFI